MTTNYYTLEELEKAKAELKSCSDFCDRYDGNNPNKGRADLRAAMRRVDSIEEGLKREGKLPYTEQELLNQKIDQAHPKIFGKGKRVEFEGKTYERHPYKTWDDKWKADWKEVT
ncbi:hypothetical protein [Dyella telluris]|uniref:Uncharacterized protein n=1 Tax=Dyella telluris TaxID=2763498 RepID=A0A7G8Q4M0_9GAMM|nr:hypothetical protein [Dyella telluris]QNK01728.1 hypothetical protein H8F01_00665 [Dyella telluris]